MILRISLRSSRISTTAANIFSWIPFFPADYGIFLSYLLLVSLQVNRFHKSLKTLGCLLLPSLFSYLSGRTDPEEKRFSASIPLGMAYLHVLLCNNIVQSTLKIFPMVWFFLSFLKTLFSRFCQSHLSFYISIISLIFLFCNCAVLPLLSVHQQSNGNCWYQYTLWTLPNDENMLLYCINGRRIDFFHRSLTALRFH